MPPLTLFLFLSLLGPRPQHMEVPRRGVESELQLPSDTTATATWDLSHICELHCNLCQCRILNPLREARDQTHILMGTSWFHFHYATTGAPWEFIPLILHF